MEPIIQNMSSSERAKEVKEFDETKAGVKGLVDSGITKIPRIFIHPPENLQNVLSSETTTLINLRVPVIDINEGIRDSQRLEIVNEIREASERWGFFQIVNHGVPIEVMEEMLEGVKGFHEQPKETKMELYSRDRKQPVRYFCNGDLYISNAANWRDSIAFDFLDSQLDSQALPLVCRSAVSEYMKHIVRVSEIVGEVISEALGVSSEYIERMECMKTQSLVCHYYPVCPEPQLTLGATKHSDPSFLTILLQDNSGGLQVLHQNHWIHVPFLKGALVANIGDLMQLITNDKFKSVEHRVLAGGVNSRVSAACFFYPSTTNMFKLYGPIKEFIHENKTPLYRETHVSEYLDYYRSKGQDGKSALPHFKL